jgi:hypothetical protein
MVTLKTYYLDVTDAVRVLTGLKWAVCAGYFDTLSRNRENNTDGLRH